ncbi:hypothetical protein E2I00_004208 [Balaenoptera physalus]|uniref:Uncharacterized protein n=1 Tax=Balaenoptera physalus TaxID=9770 RepID=A0A643CAY3_BALPH|nr:hypothetical protein E2I00_004208 [Balaenoptera physalus]
MQMQMLVQPPDELGSGQLPGGGEGWLRNLRTRGAQHFPIVAHDDDGCKSLQSEGHRWLYFGGTEDRLSRFARTPSPAEKGSVHIATQLQVNICSVARKSHEHLSVRPADKIAVDRDVPWGVN